MQKYWEKLASTESPAITFAKMGIPQAFGELGRAWIRHPAHMINRSTKYWTEWNELAMYTVQRLMLPHRNDLEPPVEKDDRFSNPQWREHIVFDVLKNAYLFNTRWLMSTVAKTPGLDQDAHLKTKFWTRQIVDSLSPSNFFATNPEAIQHWVESKGMSVVKGLRLLQEDIHHMDIRMCPRDAFTVGKELANTPGKVVYRCPMFELIQYQAQTKEVKETPVLIVPPWINKYYVMDLNQKKSMVNYLVKQGFTVFMISWINPNPDHAKQITFDDYIVNGINEAATKANEIAGTKHVSAVGYCIGGTALAIYMAWMNRERKQKAQLPVQSWTTFTTLVDFSEPGDIQAFLDKKTVDYLEEKMAKTGYLDSKSMEYTFRMMRPNTLVWNYVTSMYLCGQAPMAFDLLHWNTDGTKLPAQMHSFYLRNFYQQNKLIQPDALTIGERKIDLGKIVQPLYDVNAIEDHIVPWQTGYEITQNVSGPVRHILASSGHIQGIINPPVEPPKRFYYAGDGEKGVSATGWFQKHKKQPNSWWGDWVEWLNANGGKTIKARECGSKDYPPLCDAPGSYIKEVDEYEVE